MELDSVFNELFFARWFTDTLSDVPASEVSEPAIPVTNMMREKKNRVLSFSKLPLFELKLGGYGKSKRPFEFLTKKIADKFVVPRLLEGKEEEVLAEILPEFMPHETNLVPDRGARTLFQGGTCPVMGISWNVPKSLLSEEKEYIFYTSKDSRVRKDRYHHCWFRTNYSQVFVDYPRFLAECIVYSKALEKIKALKDLDELEREDDMVYDHLLSRLNMNISVPKGTTDSEFSRMLEGFGFTVHESSSRYLGLWPSDEKALAVYLMVKRFSFTPENLRFTRECGYVSYVPSLLADIYMLLYDSYQEDKQTYKYCKENDGGYAASFEEKKNIPQRTRDAMEKSKFKDYFSTVEYDETVDLEKAGKVAEDFDVLAELFKLPFLDGYSLRFRLLGKHHAAGLYFPFHKCLCVDVREPSSMAHELLHLLDFRLGCKSKGVSFQNIRKRYQSLVEAEVKKNPELLAKWKGGSKYNSKYYLEPTEIFARCGELYLTRVLKLQSSCVSVDATTGFAYPENEKFLGLIANYFNELFDIDSSEKEAA